MDSINVKDCIPRGNTAASKARVGSFAAAMSQTAVRKQGNLLFFAKSVLIIWKARI